MMTESSKEYSKALFLLATEENSIDEYVKALKTVKAVIEENAEYTELLASPALLLSERLSAVDEAFKDNLPENVVSFLKLIVENGHIKELSFLIDEFFELVLRFRNHISATVYSAIELDSAQKQKLVSKLQKTYGKTVDAVYIIDKSLLGGIKVCLDDKTIDGSIEKRLQKVKGVLGG